MVRFAAYFSISALKSTFFCPGKAPKAIAEGHKIHFALELVNSACNGLRILPMPFICDKMDAVQKWEVKAVQYQNVQKGTFLCRTNRFVARVLLNKTEVAVHVKNTGRLRELLCLGAVVYLAHGAALGRKTAWDLIAVESDGQIVNIDSQAPNRVFGEFLQQGGFRFDVTAVRTEVTRGDSRFDFCLELEQSMEFVEVKGVTLLRDGRAYFPDAPTERGVKHIHGLMEAVQAGQKAALVFVIQRKGACALLPNDATHPAFGAALREAAAVGVRIEAYDCLVAPDSLIVDAPVSVVL